MAVAPTFAVIVGEVLPSETVTRRPAMARRSASRMRVVTSNPVRIADQTIKRKGRNQIAKGLAMGEALTDDVIPRQETPMKEGPLSRPYGVPLIRKVGETSS